MLGCLAKEGMPMRWGWGLWDVGTNGLGGLVNGMDVNSVGLKVVWLGQWDWRKSM